MKPRKPATSPAPIARKRTRTKEQEKAELQRQIAENAYYRSERRGFAPGFEEFDWLEAEKEVRALRKPRVRRPRAQP